MSEMSRKAASVGPRELVATFTLFTVSHLFLSYPEYAVEVGREASWMEPVIGGCAALIFFLVIDHFLRKYFLGRDIIEVVKLVFGTGAAVLFSIFAAAYFILITAMVMRQFTENVITTVLPSTPILMVGGVFIVAVCYIARQGIEGVVRTGLIVWPITLVGVILLCVLTRNWWRVEWLQPMWGTGISPVLTGALHTCSLFTGVFLLCIIYPHAHDPKHLRIAGVGSIVLSTVLITAFQLCFTMVFPPDEAVKTPFPLYQVARLIYIGRFVQRLESIFVFLWVTAATIKMAITIWAAAYILSSAFKWPTLKPVLPAMGLLCFAVSMVPTNVAAVLRFDHDYFMTYGWILNLCVPMFIVLAAVLLRSFGKGGMRRA